MSHLRDLFDNNRKWAAGIEERHPGFFEKLEAQQNPRFLWIGCSDSRVPANEIVNLMPGELFVHRNVANLALPTDFSCLSVLQFAVDVLKVEHVIVCGHYRCGGVAAAQRGSRLGLIDNWLREIRDLAERHQAHLDSLPDEQARIDRLCELNVVEQAGHVCRSPIVEDAWARGQRVVVHGFIYRIGDGLLRDLGFAAASPEEAKRDTLDAFERLLEGGGAGR